MINTQLHCHTHGSNLRMLDCIVKTNDLIDRAVEIRAKAVAITDHASLSEHIKAIQKAKQLQKDGKDIKVLLGDEIYLVDDVVETKENYQPRQTKFYHFILIAKDSIGYKQLREISSQGWLSSFMTGKMRRVPNDKKQIRDIIGDNKGHLLAMSACIGGELGQSFLAQRFDKANTFIEWCCETFGKDNFAIEIQPSNNPDQIAFNQYAYNLSQDYGLRCVLTCDVHYLKKEHHDIHKAFLTSRDADRGESEDFYASTYMMTTEEEREYLSYFSDEQFEQIVNNGWEFVKDVEFIDMEHTTIIPERDLSSLDCNVLHIFKEWYETHPYLKNFAYSQYNQDRYFLRMVEQGFLDKKQEFNSTNIDRIEWELKQLWLVSDMLNDRMSAYYNLVDYIVDICWEIGFIGVSRGSVTGFYTCYLIDTHQLNPIKWNLPAYRHLNAERCSFPDVDLDSSARNRPKIIQRLKEVFGEENILNICTFKTETSKSAIKTVCRGLGMIEEDGAYLASLVPAERGKIWSISDCLYGNTNKGRKPITEFVNRVKAISVEKRIDFAQYLLLIEGLISGLSCHASGIYLFKNGYIEQNSLMKTPRGDNVTCWEMADSDYAGGLKYDSLTTECQDKLEVCMELLIKNKKIQPCATLRKTYNKYLHPDVLDYTSKEMWDKCSKGEIIDLFQFITLVGGQCIKKVQPHSVNELANANSLMRITVEGEQQPVDKFLAYKKNRSLWQKELDSYGVTDPDEIATLHKVLDYCYGVPSMQEDVMELLQEPKISGFTLGQSDHARKIIAKKKTNEVAGLEKEFFESVERLGNSKAIGNYVWNECIKPQLNYSFSRNHVLPYTVEALQEMNLYYHYPSVYWNCAALIVNAGLSSEIDNEDDDEEDEKTEEETSTKTKKATDYGKIAQAIYRSINFGVPVLQPDINKSDISFTPIEETNSIVFGFGSMNGINSDISAQIIANRPYTSFADFYTHNTYPGSLVTASKIRQLIKAGCFDCFNPNRISVMKEYICLSTPLITSVNGQNLPAILSSKVSIPRNLSAPYRWLKYVCRKQFLYGNHPQYKSKKLYWLDDRALKYFNANLVSSLTESVDYWQEDDRMIVVDKSLEKLLKPSIDALMQYINTPEFLDSYNNTRRKQAYDDFIDGVENVNLWSFDSCSFFSHDHVLAHVDYKAYNLSNYKELPEEPQFVERSFRGRTWRQYELSAICGIVLSRTDAHHVVTILTPENEVVNVKFNQGTFAWYKQQFSEVDDKGKKTVLDKSWFNRGTMIIVSGYRRGDEFVAKKYKNSIYQHQVALIESIDENNNLTIRSERYGRDEESTNEY